MSDLLKEAIADAKAVRETALANAKMALEEAFTPKLQSMLSRKLAEEAELEDEDEDEVEDEVSEELDSSEIGPGGEPDEDAKTSSEIGESRKRRGIKTEQEDGDSEDDSDSDDDYEDDEESVDEEYDSEDEDEDDDDLDLDEIISELEAELSDTEDEDEPEKAAEPVEESDDNDEDDENGDEEDEEEIDLDEIFRVLSEMDDEEEDDDDEEEAVEENKKLRNRVTQLETELAEYKDAVFFMKDKLSEVNLLNAKLLYANKLFRAYDLQQESKVKVIETLDRTATVREVKLVYSTLAESFRMSGTKRKNKVSKSSVVSEGKSSKAAGSSAPKGEILTEGDTSSERWKYLANINKK